MAAKGYIKLHRDIEDDPLWVSDEPFDKRSAWVDLILMMNHADKDIVVGNQPLTVKRGQKFTSVRKLSKRWHWSINKTLAYLKLLESTGRIYKTRTLNGTLLTLIEYDKTQGQQNTVEDTIEYTAGDTTEYTTGLQTRMIKNDIKNDKRMKKNTPAAYEDF